MKYLHILVFQIFFCYSSWSQSVDSTFICDYPYTNDYTCFARYFKNKPIERTNYFIQTIRLNENIHINYFGCMLDDVRNLSNYYFRIEADIASLSGHVNLKDKKDVIAKIEQAHSKIVVEMNFKICDSLPPKLRLFLPSKKKYRRLAREKEKYLWEISCLDDYVYNCPKDRVTYLKEYQKYIPLVILRLIQQDLDVLLEVETPPLVSNHKKELAKLIQIYEQKLVEKLKG